MEKFRRLLGINMQRRLTIASRCNGMVASFYHIPIILWVFYILKCSELT